MSGKGRSVLDRAADTMLNASVLERLLIAVMSTGIAILLGLAIVAATGYSPLQFTNDLIYGAFGTPTYISRTLRYTTLFILAGVAVAVAFRAGVFNIGVQGQMIAGGMACVMSIVWLAPFLPSGQIGGIILLLIGFTAAIVFGGLYGALPGAMKAYAGANEIITTIMLNFIAIGIVGWAVNGPVKPDDAASVRTERLPESVSFPQIVSADSTFSIVGLAIALITVAIIAVLLTRTGFGYDMVTSGYQQSAAVYSGVDAKRTIVATMTLSGMVAGITGAVFAIMVQGYFVDPGGIGNYGFDAIAISLLAANNPIGVIPASLLFGGLNASGSYIQISSSVPVQLIDGIVGLIVLFVAVPELFRMIAKRTGLGGESR